MTNRWFLHNSPHNFKNNPRKLNWLGFLDCLWPHARRRYKVEKHFLNQLADIIALFKWVFKSNWRWKYNQDNGIHFLLFALPTIILVQTVGRNRIIRIKLFFGEIYNSVRSIMRIFLFCLYLCKNITLMNPINQVDCGYTSNLDICNFIFQIHGLAWLATWNLHRSGPDHLRADWTHFKMLIDW